MLAVIVAFWPVLRCGFVNYDDDKHILSNPRFNPPKLSNALWYWTERGHFGLYIPVTYTAWTIVAQLARRGDSFDPLIFHAANLLVHIGSAIVVYFIVRRLIRSTDWPAVVGALVFALHPVQVEPVAWVSGFRDLFGGFLALLTIQLYLRFLDTHDQSRRRARFVSATAVCAFALLAKPSAVVVPVILMILDRLVYSRPWRAVLPSITPMLILSIFIAGWTRYAQPSLLLSNPVPVAVRPLVAADSIAFYLRQLVYPAHLTPDHGRHGYGIIPGILPVFLLIVLIAMYPRLPLLLVGYLVFLVCLVPVLGFASFDFQEISNVADRYMYLPMLGVAIAVAGVLARFDAPPVRVLALVALIALAARTWVAIWPWRDTQSLFTHALNINERSWLALNNLGAEESNLRQAEQLLRRAVELKPDYAEARINLGAVLAEQGRLSEAIEQFETAIRLRPDLPEARANLDKARRSRDGAPTTQ